MIQNNGFNILDILEVINLGLQVYDIHLSKEEIIDTFERLKRIEEQNKEILKLLKEK